MNLRVVCDLPAAAMRFELRLPRGPLDVHGRDDGVDPVSLERLCGFLDIVVTDGKELGTVRRSRGGNLFVAIGTTSSEMIDIAFRTFRQSTTGFPPVATS